MSDVRLGRERADITCDYLSPRQGADRVQAGCGGGRAKAGPTVHT